MILNCGGIVGLTCFIHQLLRSEMMIILLSPNSTVIIYFRVRVKARPLTVSNLLSLSFMGELLVSRSLLYSWISSSRYPQCLVLAISTMITLFTDMEFDIVRWYRYAPMYSSSTDCIHRGLVRLQPSLAMTMIQRMISSRFHAVF